MIRGDVFYKLPGGVNMLFVRKGRVMVYESQNKYIRESIITIFELQHGVNRGYLHAIRPSNKIEREILGVTEVKEKAPLKCISRSFIVDGFLVAAALACILALGFM